MTKTTISARIIADSTNPKGHRLTTYLLTLPRIILAELNTHRMFSRNSASSRAIPFNKMLKQVENDPFIPIAWQKEHKGMQGTEYFNVNYDAVEMWPDQFDDNGAPFLVGHVMEDYWLGARDAAVENAKELSKFGVTKQLCNRILEPFMWHTVIVTATEWENFFQLRCPMYQLDGKTFKSRKEVLTYTNQVLGESDHDNYTDLDWLQLNKGQSEIHMMALAEAMWDAMNESTPKQLKVGEWHIPFGDKIDKKRILEHLKRVCVYDRSQDLFRTIEDPFGEVVSYEDIIIKIATARCARVSYMNFEGSDDYEKDIKLYKELASSGHWSPFEHCAKVNVKENDWSNNFRGFLQLREIINS